MKLSRKIAAITLVAVAALGLSGCNEDDATMVSQNMSKAADNFEVQRRVVFYNGITDTYILEVTGLCSVEDQGKLAVTCKIGPNQYVKHFLKGSDNVTWFAEQLQAQDASTSHYRVTFKPSTIIPDIDAR